MWLARPFFAFLGLSTLILLAPTVQARVFDAKTFTLENGMQVVVIENHRMPVVTHMVWYKAGAADEPSGKSGIAHVFEHLMFKGTNDIPPGEFSKIVARHGGQDNAFTASDYTAYYQNIAVDRLDMVMKMEADRMVNLTLDEANFQTERDVVVEERLSRVDNDPGAILGERMDAALWSVHPYRNPIIGWAHELKALTLDDALAYYRRHYAPNNAVLVVGGDVTLEQIKPLAEKYFGGLKPAPDLPPRARVRDLPPSASTKIEMRHPRAGQPHWSRQYMAPSFSFSEGNEAYALEVFAELLGGNATSPLYRALVVDQKLASSAGSWYRGTALDWGVFGLSATPRPGVDMATLETALMAQVESVRKNGITLESVEMAKRRLIASVTYARDSLYMATRTVGAAIATGETVEDVEAWPDRINEVSAQDVLKVAEKVLGGKSPVVVGILLPETGR